MGIAVAMLVAAYLVLNLTHTGTKVVTDVTYSELEPEPVAPNTDASPSDEGSSYFSSKSTSKILAIVPGNIWTYMIGDNEEILEGWLDNLTIQQQEDFLNNLSKVIEKAETAGKSEDEIIEIINEYKSRKLSKIAQKERDASAAKIERASKLAMLPWIGALIASLSLILVMLAIERNTRKTPV